MTFKLKVASCSCPIFAKNHRTSKVNEIMAYHGFDYEPMTDPAWVGWISKLIAFVDLALTIDDSYTHIMFMDGVDIVPLGGPYEVMERYFSFNHPWIYAAEPHIWSPNSFQPKDYPTPPDVVYRYLNAGVSIGEVKHVRHWFSKWTNNGKDTPFCRKGDQDWIAARYLESYPDAIKLDIGCELFQCMCGSQVGDNPNVVLSPGKAYNHITDTYPLILHFNGGTDITDPDRRFLWETVS